MDKRIIDFITDHHVLTLATCNNREVWTANCFYVFLPEQKAFVFTSDEDTKHTLQAQKNPYIAGSVILETSTVGKIQGVQFQGRMTRPESELKQIANKAYVKRFPFTLLIKTTLWVVELSYVKMTHNILGFGKKLIWDNEKSFIEDKSPEKK